jgi:hypothetical protein
MISPWIRKIKDTLTRTCWRLRCCINRIPSAPGADLLSCTVSLIGDSGHNGGCRQTLSATSAVTKGKVVVAKAVGQVICFGSRQRPTVDSVSPKGGYFPLP